MSRELPYFKFVVAEWLLGRIIKETDATKGAFIDAIAHYWHKDCSLTYMDLQKKLGKKRLQKLIELEYIVCTENRISIPFLAEQFTELSSTKIALSKAGSKGRAKQLKLPVEKQTGQISKAADFRPELIENPASKNFIRIGRETYRVSASEYYKQMMKIHHEQWCMQNKQDVPLVEATFKRMDSDYIGYTFTDENHLQNAFLFTLNNKVKKESGVLKRQPLVIDDFYKNKKR